MAEREKALSVDELLSQQRQQQEQLRATVESTDDPLVVKLMPHAPDIGCLCAGALKVPKAIIESVVPTGEMHACCGKSLAIVDVTFKEGAVIPVTDILELLKARSAPAQANFTLLEQQQMSQRGPSHPAIVCRFGYQACIGRCGESCYNPAAGETCANGQVCQFGYRQCGCQCYNPAAGETCHRGKVTGRDFHSSSAIHPMAGCYGCSPSAPCRRQCWDENGNWYLRYDPVCC